MSKRALAPRTLASDAMVDAIRRAVATRELLPGDCLPSEPALRDRFGISITSVRRGIAILAAEGLVERRHGSGTYVREAPAPLPRRNTVALALPMRLRVYHPFFSEQQRALLDGLADGGWEVLPLIDGEAPHAAARDVSQIPYDATTLIATLERLEHAAGAVIAARLADRLPQALLERLPVVAVNETAACPFVSYCWEDEVATALACLAASGCRRIWAYDPPAVARAPSGMRVAVTAEHAPESGLLSEIAATAYAATHARLAAHPETDGILAGSDYAAQGVLDAALRAGCDPERVRIIAMTNTTSTIESAYPHSRLVADGAAVGTMLARLLTRRIARPAEPLHAIWMRGYVQTAWPSAR